MSKIRQDAARKTGSASHNCHLPRNLSQRTLLAVRPVKEFGLLLSDAGRSIVKANAPTAMPRCCDLSSSPLQKTPGLPATAAAQNNAEGNRHRHGGYLTHRFCFKPVEGSCPVLRAVGFGRHPQRGQLGEA